MSTINEFAQWAVLAFLGVYVLGLTRQLGKFLVPHREELARMGPAVGDALPDGLLTATQRQSLLQLVRTSGQGAAALVVIDERCSGCVALVEALSGRPVSDAEPRFIAFLKEPSEGEFAERVAESFDLVLADPTGEALDRADIFGTPLLLVVDGDLVVRHKSFAGDLINEARAWLRKNAGGAPADGAKGNGKFAIRTAGGRRQRKVRPKLEQAVPSGEEVLHG